MINLTFVVVDIRSPNLNLERASMGLEKPTLTGATKIKGQDSFFIGTSLIFSVAAKLVVSSVTIKSDLASISVPN